MVTIKVNERSKAGKALLEIARIFSKEKKGVEIVEADGENAHEEKIPNKKTLETIAKIEKAEDLTRTENHEDLMNKLFS